MTSIPDPTVTPSRPLAESSSILKQQYLIIFLLLLVVPIVYFSQLQTFFIGEAALSADDSPVYITDLDFWQRTARESSVTANAYFDLAHDLNNVPLTVGAWHGKDVPETNQEVMILLDPEQYIQRLYQRDTGEYLWLSMIGGRSSRPFHAPDICYDADGWQYDLGSYPITLENGGEVYGLWLEADKTFEGQTDPTEHIVFYFYLFPNQSRQLTDGIVLFKLTSGRYGSVEETLDLHADFIRELFSGAAMVDAE